MKSSAFLTHVAEAIEGGFTAAAIPCSHDRWAVFLVLTLPACECYDHHAEDVIGTRVMRFLLASAIAELEGD